MEDFNNQGVLLLESGRYQQAVDAFSQAIRLAKQELHHLSTCREHSCTTKMPLDWASVQRSLFDGPSRSCCEHEMLDDPSHHDDHHHPLVYRRGICLMGTCTSSKVVASYCFSQDAETDLQIRSAIAVYNMGLAFHLASPHDGNSNSDSMKKAMQLYANARRLLERAKHVQQHTLPATSLAFMDFVLVVLCNNLQDYAAVVTISASLYAITQVSTTCCSLFQAWMDHMVLHAKIAREQWIVSAAAA